MDGSASPSTGPRATEPSTILRIDLWVEDTPDDLVACTVVERSGNGARGVDEACAPDVRDGDPAWTVALRTEDDDPRGFATFSTRAGASTTYADGEVRATDGAGVAFAWGDLGGGPARPG